MYSAVFTNNCQCRLAISSSSSIYSYSTVYHSVHLAIYSRYSIWYWRFSSTKIGPAGTKNQPKLVPFANFSPLLKM